MNADENCHELMRVCGKFLLQRGRKRIAGVLRVLTLRTNTLGLYVILLLPPCWFLLGVQQRFSLDENLQKQACF